MNAANKIQLEYLQIIVWQEGSEHSNSKGIVIVFYDWLCMVELLEKFDTA